MKTMFRKIVGLLLGSIMVLGFLSLPAAASGSGDSTVAILEASYSDGVISVDGTAGEEVYAVAVMVFSEDELLFMETVGVSDGVFTAQIQADLSPGEYSVRAAKYEGGEYAEALFTVTAPTTGDGDAPTGDEPTGDAPTGGAASPPASPEYEAEVPGGENIAVTVDTENNRVSVDLETVAAALLEKGTATVKLPSVPGANSYTAAIPAEALSGASEGVLTVETPVGSLGIPGNMLADTGLSGKAEIVLGTGKPDDLPDDLKEAIGDRPVVRLTLDVDGVQTPWENPSAPVTVRVPYVPSQEELDNPESIVVWYIDGAGNAIPVTNGRYDPETQSVVFSVTHFSDYAVAYNKVEFSDVAASDWYGKAVGFLAARGVAKGTDAGTYEPSTQVSRAQFLVLAMRAYGIEPREALEDNFADAGNSYYSGYLAEAKHSGISLGVGGNLFDPDKDISRQEMFTFLYRTLSAIGRLPERVIGPEAADFTDYEDVEDWALEPVGLLVKSGIVSGDSGRLYPKSTATRAEAAQVLYNLLTAK